MRKLLLLMLMMVSVQMNAQDNQQKIIKLPQWVNDIKLSGYGMLQYQANDKKGNHENSFNLRIARLALEGRIANDFYWKVQMQINGNTSTLGSSPRHFLR